MFFSLFWGWSKISCNWVWGPGTARSHKVWVAICHYTICLYGLSKKQEVSGEPGKMGLHQQACRRWWDRTDSRWCGYVWWLGLFPLIPRKKPVHLNSLPASIMRVQSHKGHCHSCIAFAWFCSRTQAPMLSNNRGNILDFHYFPSLSSSGSSWCCWDCLLQRDPRGKELLWKLSLLHSNLF